MLFSKSKADPLQELKATLNTAIENAVAAKIPLGLIAKELKGRGAHFQRMIDDAAERRRDSTPAMYDPVTYQPIDTYAQAAKAEAEKAERDLRDQQAAYQEKLNERAERENFVRR